MIGGNCLWIAAFQAADPFANPHFLGFTGSAHLAYTHAVGTFAKQLKATEPASRRL
jgi:hypothetical protein